MFPPFIMLLLEEEKVKGEGKDFRRRKRKRRKRKQRSLEEEQEKDCVQGMAGGGEDHWRKGGEGGEEWKKKQESKRRRIKRAELVLFSIIYLDDSRLHSRPPDSSTINPRSHFHNMGSIAVSPVGPAPSHLLLRRPLRLRSLEVGSR